MLTTDELILDTFGKPLGTTELMLPIDASTLSDCPVMLPNPDCAVANLPATLAASNPNPDGNLIPDDANNLSTPGMLDAPGMFARLPPRFIIALISVRLGTAGGANANG